MSRPNTLDVIVISDSDPDDNLQPSASSVILVDSIAAIPGTVNSNTTSSGHPATPRGKSEPTLRVSGLGPPAETQIRPRSLPHGVIDVDADEPSDRPVSFQITANRMRPTTVQPKRARTDRLTPLPRQDQETKIDIGAWDQGLKYDYENRGTEACFIPKVVHGSAVEPGYIVPPRTRKDFIWVTVSNRNLIGYYPPVPHYHYHHGIGTSSCSNPAEARETSRGWEEAKPPHWQGQPSFGTSAVPGNIFFLVGGRR